MRLNFKLLTRVLCVACATAGGHAWATPGFEAVQHSLASPVPVGGMLHDGPVWPQYKERFVSVDGRIIDTGNGGISHSEGQGYGLLIAVAAGDRPSFDLILGWTRKNLFVRGDNLAAWKWSDGKIGVWDRNNATDGDILIAWALAEAADYWNDPAYLVQARAIARAITDKSIEPNEHMGPLVMPAAQGFSASDRPDGQVVNLSYWVFPAFARLKQIAPEYDWNRLARTGIDLVDAARFGKAQLPTDWIALGKGHPAPAIGFDKTFGYNSIRIPLYLVWSGAANPGWMQSFATVGKSNAAGVPIGRLDDETQTGMAADPGYRHIADLARCAAWGVRYPDDFYRFSAAQDYYPATMDILALMAAASADGPCVDHVALRRVVAIDWRHDRTPSALITQFAIAAAASESPKPALPAAETVPTRIASRPDIAEATLSTPYNTSIVTLLQIIGLALVLGLAIIFIIRSLRRNIHREKLVLKVFSIQQPYVAAGNQVAVPRVLPLNPFDNSTSTSTFEGQIELAAQACLRLSRTIGIIYFEVISHAKMEKQHGAVIAGNAVAHLALELRKALRTGDHVAILNHNEIVVCITLLSDATDLKSIAGRLQKIWQRLDFGSATQEADPGLAVYPMHGYQGGDLIESARAKYRSGRVTLADPCNPTIDALPNLPSPVTRKIVRRKISKRPPASKTKSAKTGTGQSATKAGNLAAN